MRSQMAPQALTTAYRARLFLNRIEYPVPTFIPRLSRRTFIISPLQQKKSKAASVRRAHEQSKEEQAEDESGRSERATEFDVDDVLEKTKGKMTKSVDWAKSLVYEGVERARGRISPGECRILLLESQFNDGF